MKFIAFQKDVYTFNHTTFESLNSGQNTRYLFCDDKLMAKAFINLGNTGKTE